jgi:polar amino acid transport system substrate-binding protein
MKNPLRWSAGGIISLLTLAVSAICFTSTAAAAECKPLAATADLSKELAKPGSLIMTFNATLPPRQYVDTDGQLKGYGIELGRMLAEALCLKPELMNMEFAAQIPGLQAGRWDIVATGLFYTEERAKLMYMVPYGVEDIEVTVSRNNSASIHSLDDLSNKRIGVESGSFQEKQMRVLSAELVKKGAKPIDIRTFDNFAHIYANLAAGQIDGAASSGLVGEYYVKRGQFASAIRNIAPTALAFGMKSKVLAEAVAAALTEMKKNGSYDALHKKYGALTYNGEFRITTGPLTLTR